MKVKEFEKSGLKVRVETETTITFTMSQDRANCILHQLTNSVDPLVYREDVKDLNDFIEMLLRTKQ